jgi:hypothetical protein
MRLTETEIQQFILHSDPSVRLAAVHYFSRPFSDNASVMPLVIEAVAKYGRVTSVHLVGEGERLAQSETTIRWCLSELRREFDEDDENLRDYRFALARILASCDLALTPTREVEIVQVVAWLPELWSAFAERVSLLGQDAESLWKELEDFCEQEKDTPYISEMDCPHAHRLVEALARGGTAIEQRVLPMLEEDIQDSDNTLRYLIQGFVIRLAGEMRLKAAVPALIELLKLDDDWFNEECERALTRIGGDDMIRLLSHEFPTADWHFRLYGTTVLEHTHSDLVVEKCLELFDEKEDETIKVQLGQALTAQFATEAIEPVRQFILSSPLDPEVFDLREAIVAASTVLGVEFPEREQWKIEQEFSQEQRRKLFAEKYGLASQVVVAWEDEDYSEVDEPDDQIIHANPKVGRNDLCPCGSGKKYKKCCLDKGNGDPSLN